MPHLIVIAGPTASGKTALSLHLAHQFHAEILSGDARQFYRGMDIGTAKPTVAERAQVPHHFIDTLDPSGEYTAGQFERDALEFLENYFTSHDVAILVGGSGLYIKAVTDGFDDLPSTPPEVRAKFDALRNEQGLSALVNLLKAQDPSYAATVDLDNPQRVQRALEAMETSGKLFSAMRAAQAKARPFQVHRILLHPERDALYDRINARVDAMIEAGLEQEARGLYPMKSFNALQTVGYQEFFDHFDGELTRDDAIDKIKQHTRNYAKRQFTWFKKQDGFKKFTLEKEDDVLRHLRDQMNV
ncbi:MAG: tRNA (adenosine(37)-N6)-dimethylallyltransferase MiaA [Flavobacteriales bacterium]|nr:tRNA (adenosine(37)-N6)-dimethylallyltransferase MiaA [Flavobacteriales bacterium]